MWNEKQHERLVLLPMWRRLAAVPVQRVAFTLAEERTLLLAERVCESIMIDHPAKATFAKLLKKRRGNIAV